MTTADRRSDVLYAALADTHKWLEEHWADGSGLCVCLKALPCPVAERIALYAFHLLDRIDYSGPDQLTILLPIIRTAADPAA